MSGLLEECLCSLAGFNLFSACLACQSSSSDFNPSHLPTFALVLFRLKPLTLSSQIPRLETQLSHVLKSVCFLFRLRRVLFLISQLRPLFDVPSDAKMPQWAFSHCSKHGRFSVSRASLIADKSFG
jgi:hypothetical protein